MYIYIVYALSQILSTLFIDATSYEHSNDFYCMELYMACDPDITSICFPFSFRLG